ncbi:hypothetical protein PInf_008310 [Phytophthora infestans]|nr:hypothetical protein PInf_008310 [Phytophthora infestans]
MELSDDDNTDKYRLTSTSDDAEGIEETLYGFAGATDEETCITLSFLLKRSDAAVLQTFELATLEDPLQYFGLKWLYGA